MNKRYRKLLIIDGSYLLHRSMKVPDLWELRSPSGVRSGGIYGFLNSISYLTRNYRGYYPVVAWDMGRNKRRLEIYPMYKNEHLLHASKSANKENESLLENYSTDSKVLEEMKVAFDNALLENKIPKNSDDDYVTQYINQKNELLNLLELLGVPSIIKKGWEGDDIISLISRVSKQSYVVTDDRDMIQLLSEDISIIRPLAKEELTYKNYLETEDLYNTRELVIIKAICGDGSDNIPGVTSHVEERKYRVGGVRAKKIAKILLDNNEDFESCKDIILNEVKNPGIGFVENYDLYKRNLELVDLNLVPDDSEVYDAIDFSIRERNSRRNLLHFISEVGRYGITTVDYQQIMSNLSSITEGIIL